MPRCPRHQRRSGSSDTLELALSPSARPALHCCALRSAQVNALLEAWSLADGRHEGVMAYVDVSQLVPRPGRPLVPFSPVTVSRARRDRLYEAGGLRWLEGSGPTLFEVGSKDCSHREWLRKGHGIRSSSSWLRSL